MEDRPLRAMAEAGECGENVLKVLRGKLLHLEFGAHERKVKIFSTKFERFLAERTTNQCVSGRRKLNSEDVKCTEGS